MVSPFTEREIERLAESVYIDAEGEIYNRETFDKAMAKYFQSSFSYKQRRELIPKVYARMRELNPTLPERRTYAPRKTDDKPVYKYNRFGFVGKKIVRARLESYEVKGQTKHRLRSEDGKFVSREREE